MDAGTGRIGEITHRTGQPAKYCGGPWLCREGGASGASTCRLHASTIGGMPNLQIRNVPKDLHRALKTKAAVEGSSLSVFVLAELEQIAKRPTPRELRKRLRRREPVQLSPTAAEVIREVRERG